MMKPRVKLAVNNAMWDQILRWFLIGKLHEELGCDDRLCVLEVGCGRGGTTEILLERLPNAFITATDIDDEQIRLAERRIRNERVEFLVEHAAELSFDTASFDIVTAFNLLHHVPAWKKAVSEAGRVLRPGGRFVVSGITPSGLNTSSLFRRFVAPKSAPSVADVICEAKRRDMRLVRDVSHPKYMRLVFRKMQEPARKSVVYL